VIFPEKHPYYGLDVGQDLIGLGEFPDDTVVVWNYTNPDLAGTSAAPYQFVLYSQVGLVGALAASVVVGLFLALLWRFSLFDAWPTEWRSLLGGLTMLLAVYIAIDSVRNSITVSYGVGWGFLFVFGAAALTHLANSITVSARGAK
jgi:hypothetical protein